MTATGKFNGLNSVDIAETFTYMLEDPLVMGGWMIFVVIIGIFICSRGLQNGIERITKVMMISLLFIMLLLAVNSFTLDGAKEGLKFYLIPDFERMKEAGIIATITGAMNQAFLLSVSASALWPYSAVIL